MTINPIQKSAKSSERNPMSRQKTLWLECATRGLCGRQDIMSALDQLSVNPQDQECEQFLISQINAQQVQDILHPDEFRRLNPSGSSVNGPVQLGKVRHTGATWGIHPQALTEHIAIIGRTGGGKSCLIKQIISQILETHDALDS